MNDNKPDDFWPWRALDIDEDEWEFHQRPEPHPETHLLWFWIGAIIGLTLVVVGAL